MCVFFIVLLPVRIFLFSFISLLLEPKSTTGIDIQCFFNFCSPAFFHFKIAFDTGRNTFVFRTLYKKVYNHQHLISDVGQDYRWKEFRRNSDL